jgi:hypothetical protein
LEPPSDAPEASAGSPGAECGRSQGDALGVTAVSERVVDAGEDGDPLGAVADVDVADDEGHGDGAEAEPADGMEAARRVVVQGAENAAGIV